MHKLLLSFYFALQGLAHCVKRERNFGIQLFSATAVLIISFVLQIQKTEWMIIIFSITVVLCLEMINSAIERLCNLITLEFHPSVKTIKDISAGAVLLASVASAVIAVIIFTHKLL